MSRKIFKSREPVATSPFQFQAPGHRDGGAPANALDAEAELDVFQYREEARPSVKPNQNVDVRTMIEQAQTDAEGIVNEAKQKAAEIEREAYEKGLQEGRKTGEIMADQQLQAVLTLYHHSISQLDRVREIMLDRLQLDIFDLILHTSEKIVKTELNTHPQVILSMVKAAIQTLKERKDLILFLHQEDHQYLVSLSVSEKQSWLGTQINLEIDPSLNRGSFRIETAAGELDAHIETQLQQLRDQLNQAFEPS